jgi:WD40 repeat protein
MIVQKKDCENSLKELIDYEENKMDTLINILPKKTLKLNGKSYILEKVLTGGGLSVVYLGRAKEEEKLKDWVVIKEFFPKGYGITRDENGALIIPPEKQKEVDKLKLIVKREVDIAQYLRDDRSFYKTDDKSSNDLIFEYDGPIESEEYNTLYTIIKTGSGKTLLEKINNFNDFISICNCVLDILTALEPVHDKKTLHLDIAPDNIHISTSGTVRLIDYNSAFRKEIRDEFDNLIRESDDLGTWQPSYKPGYSARELENFSQTKPIEPDYQTDLYSVTAIFFRLLKGRTLLEGDWRNNKKWRLNNQNGYLKGYPNRIVQMVNDFLWKGINNHFKNIPEMKEAIEILRNGAEEIKKRHIYNFKYFKNEFYYYTKKNEGLYGNLYVNNQHIPIKLICNELSINIMDFINDNNFRYACLTGEGGMGKTYTCINLGIKCIDKEKCVVYIPLHDYDKQYFIEESIKVAFGIQSETEDVYKDLINEEEIFILLDGYNEINSNYIDNFAKEFEELCSKSYLKILITSRNDDYKKIKNELNAKKFEMLSFMLITNEIIDEWMKKYTSQNTKVLPSEYNVLRNPMFLKIYAYNINEQKKTINPEDYNFLKNPTTAGEIIWNFLEHQIIKSEESKYKNTKENNIDIIREGFGKILLRYLLPCIAYNIEIDGKLDFELPDLEKYIKSFDKYYNENNNIVPDFIKYKSTINYFLYKLDDRANCLIEQCTKYFCIVYESGETYTFTHQYFRDIFSATHIKNQMELICKNKSIDISVFTQKTFLPHIIQMLSQILQEHKKKPPKFNNSVLREYIQKLKEIFKEKNDEEIQRCVFNSLEIINYARNGNMSHEDFSELDLRAYNFNNIICDNTKFIRSCISKNTFFADGHDSIVRSVNYSPNGTYIVSASNDKTVKIWEIYTRKLLHTLSGHLNSVFNAIFSPIDGKYIASVSCEAIILWDRVSGKQLYEPIKGDFRNVLDISFSPDEKYIASSFLDKNIKIWETTTGNPCTIGNEIFTGNVEYLYDDTSVFSNLWDNSYKVFINHNGRNIDIFKNFLNYDGFFSINNKGYLTIHWLKEKSKAINSDIIEKLDQEVHSFKQIEYSSNGRYISFITKKDFLIIKDIENNENTYAKQSKKAIYNARFAPKSEYIILGLSDGTIEEWDIIQRKIKRVFGNKCDYTLNNVNLSRDGEFIIMSTNDDIIMLKNIKRECLINYFEGSNAFYSQNDNYFFIIYKNILSIYDNFEYKLIKNCPHYLYNIYPDYIEFAKCSSKSNYIATVSKKRITIWKCKNGENINFFEHYETRDVQFSPDENYILVTNNDYIKIYNIHDKSSEVLKDSSTAYSAQYSPNGELIIYAQGINIYVYDIKNKTTRKIDGKAGSDNDINWFSVQDLCCGADIQNKNGNQTDQLIIGILHGYNNVLEENRNEVKIWDIETGNLIPFFDESINCDSISKIKYSPNGLHLIVFYERKGMKIFYLQWIWSKENGTYRLEKVISSELKRFTDEMNALSNDILEDINFNSNGRYIFYYINSFKSFMNSFFLNTYFKNKYISNFIRIWDVFEDILYDSIYPVQFLKVIKADFTEIEQPKDFTVYDWDKLIRVLKQNGAILNEQIDN